MLKVHYRALVIIFAQLKDRGEFLKKLTTILFFRIAMSLWDINNHRSPEMSFIICPQQ